MAMTAAETGHLVLGTLHTTSAVKTIDRIIDALPVRGARADQELPGAEPARRRHADPGEDRRRPRPQGDLRSDDDDQGHRQAHPDRPDAPDSDPAADGPRPRHAAARPGAARRHRRRTRSIPTTPTPTPSDKRAFQKYVTDTSMLPKLDIDRLRRPRLADYGGLRRSAHRGADRRLPDRGAGEARLGPALHRRRSAAHPPVRRSHAAASPTSSPPSSSSRRCTRSCRRPALDRFEAKDGADFAYTLGRSRALPRQRDAPAERHGRGVPRHSLQGADDG